ncbi:MAG: hypothetical protein E7314_07925 [Clostridiales bacterium]|nr:hypothetical protein [Clostridiales bacterium]
MNFFESELKKIIKNTSNVFPATEYIGRACYGFIDKNRRAKIKFESRETLNQYDTLSIEVLDVEKGCIDKNFVRFDDLFGRKKVDNPNFSEGIVPHIWENGKSIDWYVYKLTEEDFEKIGKVVSNFVCLYKDMEMVEYTDLAKLYKKIIQVEMPEVIDNFLELEEMIKGKYNTFYDWIKIAFDYSEDMEEDFGEVADDIYKAFLEVRRKHGSKIAKSIYDAKFITLPNEIEAVGEYLNMGGKTEHIEKLAYSGYFMSCYNEYTFEQKTNVIEFLNMGGNVDEIHEVLKKKEIEIHY